MRADRDMELKTKAGEEPKFVEGIVEDAVESEESESESEKSESEDDEDDEEAKKESSEGTHVVSEEGTEVLGSEDPEEKRKKNVEDPMDQDEEVNQEAEGEERDIVLLEDDDTIDGNKLQEVVDQRTRRRKIRVARRIAEILTAEKDRKREIEPSKAEDEEEKEIPLKRRPRSARVAEPEETPILITGEDAAAPVDEAKDADGEPIDEGKYKQEEKEKGSCQNAQLRRKSNKLIAV